MPVSDLHRQVASIALGAATEHGFALGGGNALIAHELISLPTQDVDLFTNQEHGVEAAAGTVEAALRDAGFAAERQDKTAGLSDIFPGMGEGLAEWIVTSPGGDQMALQMAYFDRGRDPVDVVGIGPVLDLEDAVGGKVCALASRAYERDYIDTAALQHYIPEQLISFARRLDPGLDDRDFADAGQRLDQLPDDAFTAFGLTRQAVTTLRERFTDWPRTAQASQPQQDAHKQRTTGERNTLKLEPPPDAELQPRREEREADHGGAEIEP